MRKFQAAEKLTIEQARERLDVSANWAISVLNRLSFVLPKRRLKILEIGSAQGRALIGLAKLGHDCCGVEPYIPAIIIANELSAENNVVIDIREGRAESLPFGANHFDLVLAFAVMEHVENVDKALEEIFRVLKPDGVFWFSSASSNCPIQREIKGFPFFGWYPDNIKRKIMWWAVKNRPDLIGYTENPAINWWTNRKANRILSAKGFIKVMNRWELKQNVTSKKITNVFISVLLKFRPFIVIGDVIFPGCSFAAIK